MSYCEITLKSNTEPAIIAFRNRVAEMREAEVTTEDAVTGDKPSNGVIENTLMLLRGIIVHKVVRAGNIVVLDVTNPHIRNTRDGTVIKLAVNTKQHIDEFGATVGCPWCNAIKDDSRVQTHSDRCRV